MTKLPGPWMRLLCCFAGAVGLYHVHPCSSSCFPAPQQAFVGEMGQRRASLAWSSTFFENGRNLVSKSSAETHGPAAGQKNEKSTARSRARKQAFLSPGRGQENNGARPFAQTAGAVGLYHVHPCSSSCFPAPQQAFVGEMGQKRRLVAASSYVFEKGRNFSKQVER